MEKTRSRTIALRAFYTRRVLRIWPLYFAFLGAVALAGSWLPLTHISLPFFASMALLSTNWYFIAGGVGAAAVQPLWSIAVEEQFYLLWPFLFRALSRQTFLALAVGIGIASLALAGFHPPNYLVWFNTGSEAIFFAGGALCALLTSSMEQPTSGLINAQAWVTPRMRPAPKRGSSC